jgi:hypothetical protein
LCRQPELWAGRQIKGGGGDVDRWHVVGKVLKMQRKKGANATEK